MRIDILTFHWNYNYGAVLQAQALRQAILALGAEEVKFINFVPPTLAHHASRGWGITTGAFLPTLSKRWKFRRFRAKYCPSTPPIRTLAQLQKHMSNCDAVVVGSDQVWNIKLVGQLEPSLFLGVKSYPSERKISYAATFGNAGQPAAELEKAGAHLREIGSISVRDEMSRAIVHQLTGRDATVVLDPTLLSDAAVDPRTCNVPKDYILAYFVDVFSPEAQAMVATARDILKLPVVAVSVYRDLPGSDLLIRNAGVEEWLYLFERASAVITDSFHGSVFALKNKKPVYALCGNDERANRIEDLTKAFDREDVVVRSASEMRQKMMAMHQNISALSKLQEKRLVSSDFLKAAFNRACSAC